MICAMKLLLALTSLFALATAAPTPAPQPPQPITSVRLRTIGLDTTHYTTSTQRPAKSGHIITISVGQALSLDQNPLLLQGFEIVSLEPKRNTKVFCKVSLGYSSAGVVVSMKDGMRMLDGGKVVQVTGLSCGFDKEIL
jgi:hypothetical protein